MTDKVIRDAIALLERQHHQPAERWLIAVDRHGERVRPLSQSAVGFSIIGALTKVAPGQSMTNENVYADLSAHGTDAYELIEIAAAYFGYQTLADVDRAGTFEVLRVVRAALNDYQPEPRRHLHAVGTGSNPRGAAA